jgi:hypothetical protein
MDNAIICDFRNDSTRYALKYPDTFRELPIPNLRKLFKLMRFDDTAVDTTRNALSSYVQESKRNWDTASSDFVNGYVDVKNRRDAKIREIKAKNNKLYAAVKTAKSERERAKKISSLFDECTKF